MDNYITIPLSKRGKYAGQYEAIVSIEDADLTRFNWSVVVMQKHWFYASRSISPKPKRVYLHRVILSRILGRDLLSDENVDHIDGDGLNNRRDNLRLATNSQNMMNTRKLNNNKSGYKGVGWHKKAQKWRARIMTSNGRINIGYFDTPELAYEVYCKAAIEYYGEFARLE